MFDYRLRVSPWARGLSLQVTAEARLEVIAPRRVGRRTIARVLAEQHAWIAAALAQAEARRRTRPAAPPCEIPVEITLPAIAAHWAVTVCPTAASGTRVAVGEDRLVVSGQVTEIAACRQALRRWLVRQGRRHLVPWVETTSRTHGIPYSRCAVRLTRSQWGCCYRSGLISLSARLLFLPPPVVNYVLVHELCHTREQNHSAAFWRLVEHHCPDCRQRRADLRRIGPTVPAWVVDRRG